MRSTLTQTFISRLVVTAAAVAGMSCAAGDGGTPTPPHLGTELPPAGAPPPADSRGLVSGPAPAAGPNFEGVTTLAPNASSGGVTECDGERETTLRGTVFDPAGRLPLYNVMVYVPTTTLDPIVEGVTCDRCDATASGTPVAAAVTDAKGEFVMADVPDGANVPLVLQMGKWRREITLPLVLPCQENTITDRNLLRLPRSQAEGHLPKIALTTGGADKLECMLRKIGVADSEFTNPEGPGRVNLFRDSGGTSSFAAGGDFPAIGELLASSEALARYDMVLMSCHGSPLQGVFQPTAEKAAMKAYVDRGGRAFGSHFHSSYLRSDDDLHQPTPFPDVGVWEGAERDTYNIETGFPKGQAFAQWLVHVGASPAYGTIELDDVEGAARSLDTPYTQSWITAPESVPYFSLNLPIEKAATPEEQCGRFVHTGIHVSEGDEDPFPTGCDSAPPTPQEMALEFLIFDLSACPLRVDVPPAPPTIIR